MELNPTSTQLNPIEPKEFNQTQPNLDQTHATQSNQILNSTKLIQLNPTDPREPI